MTNNTDFARVSKIIAEKQSFAICLPTTLTADNIAAATALYVGLLKLGKNASIASAGEIPQNITLHALEKIQKELVSDGDQLVISIPYTEGAIDKITSSVEKDRLNIIVIPQNVGARIDSSQVKYSYRGGSVDAVIVIDTPALNLLGSLYERNKDQFNGVELINIDRHFTNANFGSVNIVDKKSASLSELVFGLLTALRVPIDRDIAANLYAGIIVSTNNFTAYSVGPATFETAAQLLKAGAVKKIPGRMGVPQRQQMPIAGGVQSYRSVPPVYEPEEYNNEAFDMDAQEDPGMMFPPDIQASVAGPSEQTTEVENKESHKETPKDWLKPNIFKGGNRA